MYMNEISISKATELPKEFYEALENWRVEAQRILNSDEIQWYSKLASTTFTYCGLSYIVTSEDVYSKEDLENCLENVLDAGFEILQATITKDLRRLGAENIRKLNLPGGEKLARICERHTGSGILAAEIRERKLRLPERDLLPESAEEKIICLADKFFSKSGAMEEKSVDQIRKGMLKFGEASLERFDELLKFASML